MTNQRTMQIIDGINGEMQKCRDSPLYFWNTYVRHEDAKELTQEEYDAMVVRLKMQREEQPFDIGKHLKNYPKIDFI